MPTRPSRYPQVAVTPGANYAEPPSGVQISGWPYAGIFPSSDANWLFDYLGDWARDADGAHLRATDVLSTSIPCRVSTTILDIYDGIDSTLTATITSGGVYYHGVAGRIDLSDAPAVYSGGNALVFPPSTTSYVIARARPAQIGGTGGASCAELAISAVTPVAGWATILQVTTNATQITNSSTHSGVSSWLQWSKAIEFLGSVKGGSVDLTGTLTAKIGVFGTPDVGNAAIYAYGPDLGQGVYAGSTGSGQAIYAFGGAAATGSVGLFDASSSAGAALEAIGNATSPAIFVRGRVNVQETSGASYGLQVGGSGSVANMLSTNASGTGRGFYCSGSATGGEGAYFEHNRTTGSPYTIYARTAAAADVTARAILAEGRNEGFGVHSKAVTGAAFFGEVSNNAGVPFLASTRTADTTYGFSGGLMFNAAAAVNQWRATISGFSGVKSLAWYGPGSFLHGYEVTTGPISDFNVFDNSFTTITMLASEGNGFYGASFGARIRIRITFDARCIAAGASGVDIRLTDETNGGTTIVERSGAGTGTTAGWALPNASTDWQKRIAFECEYAPPNDGDLTIRLKIKRNTGGQIAVRDIVMEAVGTFPT